jgi:hypothetical protein
MTRYLIEVPHENSKQACVKAIRVFLETGSHFLSNADWGCSDDEHKAWIVVEMDTKKEAKAILPPLFRPEAKIIALEKFTKEDLDKTMEQHNH